MSKTMISFTFYCIKDLFVPIIVYIKLCFSCNSKSYYIILKLYSITFILPKNLLCIKEERCFTYSLSIILKSLRSSIAIECEVWGNIVAIWKYSIITIKIAKISFVIYIQKLSCSVGPFFFYLILLENYFFLLIKCFQLGWRKKQSLV